MKRWMADPRWQDRVWLIEPTPIAGSTVNLVRARVWQSHSSACKWVATSLLRGGVTRDGFDSPQAAARWCVTGERAA